MYSLNVKKRTVDKETAATLKQTLIASKLKIKKERLGSRSRQRQQEWLQMVDDEDCKLLCEGAIRGSVSPTLSPTKKMSNAGTLTFQNDFGVDEGSLNGPSAILKPENTYFNRVYLRTYEPEYVRRAKTGGASSYLQGHLEQEAFKGNPDQVFKGLLRKRDLTAERQRTRSSMMNKPGSGCLDHAILDSSAKDMSMYYHPDFRSPPVNQYETVYQPEEDQQRE